MLVLKIENHNNPIAIKLRDDLAPKHVQQITTLAKDGFYNGIIFHRVIEGFMAQTGDPTGTGCGGSELPNIPAEFTEETFKRGTVGMARSQNPDSGNSQFFICFNDASFLDRQYTVFGNVIHGMSTVDTLNRGEPPTTPSKIETAEILTEDEFKQKYSELNREKPPQTQ